MCFLLEFVLMKFEKDVSISVLYFKFYFGNEHQVSLLPIYVH
jgi:hypothetical protein